MIEAFFLTQNAGAIEKIRFEKKRLLQDETEKFLGPGEVQLIEPELLGDRSRLDLMWFEGKLGIRSASRFEADSRTFDFFEIKDPDSCQKEISQSLKTFSKIDLGLEMAQLRFRVGSQGHRGLWIDCANVLIKNLLEKTEVLRVLEKSWDVVEFGQKAKTLCWSEEGGRYRLGPPRAFPWMSSFGLQSTYRPNFYVSSFSQPGPKANQVLVNTLSDISRDLPKNLSWAEWGAGYGNFTYFLQERFGSRGWTSEADPKMATLLKENLSVISNSIKIEQARDSSPCEFEADLFFLDPPRSGFPELFTSMKSGKIKVPQFILAIHCHEKGRRGDWASLNELGFKAQDIVGVDIFPGTPHLEAISLWKR